MNKQQLVKELECITCGSYKELKPIDYTKTVSKKRGAYHYTRTKIITVPICKECLGKKKIKILQGYWILGLAIIWILIFVVALLICDFGFQTNGLFLLMSPVFMIGLLVFIAFIPFSLANQYSLRTSVKFESGINNDNAHIYSRRKGKWIHFSEWIDNVIGIKNQIKLTMVLVNIEKQI